MKNYIIDTNVLLHDPHSLLSFADNHVLIPIEVIEEIDRFKRESTELGQNARTVSRMLDGFRGDGSLSEGVKLPNGGKLKIAFYKNGQHNGEDRFPRTCLCLAHSFLLVRSVASCLCVADGKRHIGGILGHAPDRSSRVRRLIVVQQSQLDSARRRPIFC